MSPRIAVIVGSGFASAGLKVDWGDTEQTPWGEPSGPVGMTAFGPHRVAVLARHGLRHTIAPHRVNYRANVWALKAHGAEYVIGANVVGAIAAGFGPADVAVPEQLIDYTWGRETTFGDLGAGVPHVDFTLPFDPDLRGLLATAAADLGLTPQGGTYAVTQGPRLETAAEIDRLERDGAAMVGMTAMPEAVLAREAGLRYAIVAAAVNYAAGRSPAGMPIHAELAASVRAGMDRLVEIIARTVAGLEAKL